MALSCACFAALLTPLGPSYISPLLFAVVILLACFEKLAYTANTVAVERDWVSFSHYLGQAKYSNYKKAIVVSDALQIPRQGEMILYGSPR